MMTDPAPLPGPHFPEDEAERRTRGPWRWVLYTAALLLMGVCVWLAIEGGRGEAGSSGWRRLGEADPADLLGMLGLVVGSIAINGWVFWAVVKPFETDRPVGLVDMTAMIAATSLLNYLPMRAGLLGRAAYLKRQHGIDYRVSAVMLVMVAGGTVYVFALLAAATLWRGRLDGMWWAAVGGGLAVGAAAAAPAVRIKLRFVPGVSTVWFDRAGAARTMLAAAALMAARGLDVLCLAGRLWLAGRIFGAPMSMAMAMLMATGGMFVTLATPLPNGLGLREGVYGLLAAAGLRGEALPSGALGVSLGLIDRAAEAIVFIAAGCAALAYLHRRSRARKEMEPQMNTDEHG